MYPYPAILKSVYADKLLNSTLLHSSMPIVI